MYVRILQVKDIRNSKYLFMDYDFATSRGFDLNDYECVYDYIKVTTTSGNRFYKPEVELEEIYEQFNIRQPQDFKGHSLSVSDIVELDGTLYYVDSVGFTKIN